MPGECKVAVRLREKYQDEVIAALREEFGYKNIMQVPCLEKIVVNMGVGDAIADAKMMDMAVAASLFQILNCGPA